MDSGQYWLKNVIWKLLEKIKKKKIQLLFYVIQSLKKNEVNEYFLRWKPATFALYT